MTTQTKTHHQFFEDIKKFPNKLCLYRLFAIIACCSLFIWGGFPVTASMVGLSAGLTDYADGIYARKHNMVTRLGALLDTVADLMFNFFVISTAVYMGVWPIWALFLWGFRDLSVLTMRASAAQLGIDIPSSYLGKLASNFIFYALFLMPIDYALNSPNYRFAEFVSNHIHQDICVGLHWFAFIGLLIGIVMQWYAAFSYAKVYIRKYDEVHKAEAQAKAQDESDKDSKSEAKAQAESDKDSDSEAKAQAESDKNSDSEANTDSNKES